MDQPIIHSERADVVKTRIKSGAKITIWENGKPIGEVTDCEKPGLRRKPTNQIDLRYNGEWHTYKWNDTLAISIG